MTRQTRRQVSKNHEPKNPIATRGIVLVIEDDLAVSELLIALLEEKGYTALAAVDGATALNLAHESPPHLITLDLGLAGAEGHAVLETLRADPVTREVPLVVISAFTQVLPAGERKKVAYLLGKPFDVSEMLDVIEATVGNPYL